MRTASTTMPYTRNTETDVVDTDLRPYSGRKMLNPVTPTSVAARRMPGRMAAGRDRAASIGVRLAACASPWS